ncbi:LysE family transporter [Trinickia caryophylli]|uniref:Arginine exporter protein ArgO n=1 Tax=Trinickia caryophylli TaxID=28094 RepID=A0A1X7DHV1_TRICW|nr:LysE family transporter [Trinickia caryophylli]PMS12404.1 lysine transporter LysE [Trinickia caryophylli]TRX16985.1 lysine transporter LysE [Trinickia caryophylli]WQE12277.1 LysE family transporter [Trinickia caryophylli]SMF15492.1 Arginine exporter protein ArgO [Trinickia caryophylli]GLU31578.1 lysine transporter LysE [Trinickia caryophylli]
MDTILPTPLPTLFGQSLLIGLSIAAPVGQIGLLAIQRTLQRGPRAGLATGLGAAFADAVYGAIGAFGVTGLIGWLLSLRLWLGLFGGAFLLWLAWRIATQPAARGMGDHAPPGTLLHYVAGTFVLTLSNPTTILSFMAVFGALAGHAPTTSPWVMIAGVLLGSALWWLILSSCVGWLRERFDARWQRAVNLCSAGMLAGLGLWQLGQILA